MRHTLVSGMDRSERQAILRDLISSAERETPHVEVWLAAPGAVQADLEWHPARFAAGEDEVRWMVEDAHAVLEEKLSCLAATGGNRLEPTASRPALLLVIENVGAVLSNLTTLRLVEAVAERGHEADVTLFLDDGPGDVPIDVHLYAPEGKGQRR